MRNEERIHGAADIAKSDMAGSVGGNHSDRDLRAPAGNGNSYRQTVGGGADGATPVKTETDSDYSPKAQKSRARKTAKTFTTGDDASEKVVDLAAFRSKVTIHSSAVFDDDKWKRSRIKKGCLIARIAGYDIVESEYGASYLKVVKRDPKTKKKKTSGDYSLYEHAGFFTWRALQAGGRFVKEKKRYERVSGDSANAS